jgi:AcrR family transcriptional regulator
LASQTLRKRPRQARARATFDAIVEATAQVLVSEGYTGLSTNRVAERAGVSIGTLYQYFGNKDGLIDALIDRELERHFQMIAPWLMAHPEESLRGAVRRYVQQTLKRHAQHGPLVRALFIQADRSGHAELTARWLSRLEPLVEQAIRSYAPVGHPAMTAAILCRAVHHSIEMAIRDRPHWMKEAAFGEELVSLIVGFLEGERG